MTRQFFYDVWHLELLRALAGSSDERIAAIAAKGAREVAYHVERSRDWVVRLGDGTDESHARMQRALDDLWPYTGELFAADAVDEAGLRAGWGCDPAALREPWLARGARGAARGDAERAAADGWMQSGGKTRPPQRAPGLSAGRDAVGAPLRPRSDVVTPPRRTRPPVRRRRRRDGVGMARRRARPGDSGALGGRSGHRARRGVARERRRARAARRDLADLFGLSRDGGDPARHRAGAARARRREREARRAARAALDDRLDHRRRATRNCAPTASRRPSPPQRECACPRCAAARRALVSRFGSTPCKALYRCNACREPFDHFKCH